MNALANDQLERIQEYLQASGFGDAVQVGAYNRSTSEDEREHMRKRPPHLLLTNYQMLEYLLTRPQDRDSLFAGHRCRFVVLDEVHTYRGTLGTHVALLLRRLLVHLRRANPQTPPFIPIGTSATIRSERAVSAESPPNPVECERAVQQFFGKLEYLVFTSQEEKVTFLNGRWQGTAALDKDGWWSGMVRWDRTRNFDDGGCTFARIPGLER